MVRVVSVNDFAGLPRPGSPEADFDEFLAAVRQRGVYWPEEVVRDVLFDHGAKEHILSHYGHLDLQSLRWSIEACSAATLISAKSCFEEYVETVAEHPHFTIEHHRATRPHAWEGTWEVPPYFMVGSLWASPHQGLHLVEGHTRVGILRGLVRLQDIDGASLHRIFLATSDERTGHG